MSLPSGGSGGNGGGGGGGGRDPLSRAKLRGGVLCAASLLPVSGRQTHGGGSSSSSSNNNGGGSGSGDVLRGSLRALLLNSGDISVHFSILRAAVRESRDDFNASTPRQHDLGVAVITGGLGRGAVEQSKKMSHIDIQDDHINTVISHIDTVIFSLSFISILASSISIL